MTVPTPDSLEQIEDNEGPSLLDLALPLARHVKLLVAVPLLIGCIAVGISYLIPPTFTARTTFLPPQQQQSAASSALASLGALGGLAGMAAGGLRTPADQYAALLESTTIADRIIDQFKLMEVYEAKLRVDARFQLSRHLRVMVGKKDGLITVEVDDHDPKRAAAMANQHVDELRRLTGQLALTEAQQRRLFFETQMKKSRDQLTDAQRALQASGFNQGALKAEPKAAAEGYAQLKAELTAGEVRLQALRQTRSDSAPEVQQSLATLSALRAEIARAEASSASPSGGPDYVSKYRDFKYQEALFELFSRQYEMARVDESREGTLIQVIDPATPPEKKSKPRRATVGLTSTGIAFVVLLAGLLVRERWQQAKTQTATAEKIARLREALRGR
jgi:uncharacterized protein involved in exopolysaccharide biosynthesis